MIGISSAIQANETLGCAAMLPEHGLSGAGISCHAGGGSATSPGSSLLDRVRIFADETETPARYGADQLLFFAAVADRLAGGVDTAGQGGFRDDPTLPHRGDQIVLADDSVAILDQ